MWEVPSDKLLIKLPSGFRLMEDEAMCGQGPVYLFYGDERVATFYSTGVSPAEIEKAAKEHLDKKQKEKEKE